jgi:O-antigen/teichoic acid export membrane protein
MSTQPMSTPGADAARTHADDLLDSGEAGGKVIRGSAWRVAANGAGIVLGLATATLLLHHLGVVESGRYVTVLSLVAIPVYVADIGLNVAGSRELTLSRAEDRRALTANILGQRIVVMPVAVLLVVAFTVLAGYPASMVAGAALAGAGVFLVALANVLLLPLTVELRNAGLAAVDVAKQVVGLAGVALLVALGAKLAPFFAVQLAVGVVVIALVPLLVGRGAFLMPRRDSDQQRVLMRTAFPLATALALGQAYFRLVIVLMSLISTPVQTGYYGGSLRAMENVVLMPILVAGVALPVFAAAARDDWARLRYAIEGLSKGALIAGVLVVLVTIRAAEPVMALIGGAAFRPAGDVLRIQVCALLFIALYQLWSAALLALDHQRELIFTNGVALVGLAVFSLALIPPFGAEGGAAASVLGDAVLASLIYWRLSRVAGRVMVSAGFLARVAVAAALAGAVLLIAAIPDLVAAALCGVVFLGVGQLIGMIPPEVHQALGLRKLLMWRTPADV